MLRVCNEWENFKDSNCSLRETLCLPFSHTQTSWCMESSTEGCSGFCLMKRRLGRPRQHMNQQHRMCHPPPPGLSSSYIISPGITGSVYFLNILSGYTHFHCWSTVLKDCDSTVQTLKSQRQERLKKNKLPHHKLLHQLLHLKREH